MVSGRPLTKKSLLAGLARSGSVPDVTRHAYDAGLKVFPATVVGRLLYSVWLFSLGVAPMGWFLVGSGVLYAIAWWVHTRGYVAGGFCLAVLDAIITSWAGTVIVGWSCGFQLSIWPFIAIMALTTGMYPTLKIFLGVAMSAVYMALLFGRSDAPPLYVLSPLAVQALHACNTIVNLFAAGAWAWRFSNLLTDAEARAASEFQRSETLLDNMLPAQVLTRIKGGATEVADGFDQVTVLFADIVGFTSLAARTAPRELVAMLDQIFSELDALAAKHGVEKIKTIGDAYMAAAGVPEIVPDAAQRMAAFAVEVLKVFDAQAGALRVRVGMATGPAVAGVIGTKKFSYDVWGDTVNTAARMESHGEAGRIHIDANTRAALSEGWSVEPRGPMPIKGKGTMETYFLLGRAS